MSLLILVSATPTSCSLKSEITSRRQRLCPKEDEKWILLEKRVSATSQYLHLLAHETETVDPKEDEKWTLLVLTSLCYSNKSSFKLKRTCSTRERLQMMKHKNRTQQHYKKTSQHKNNSFWTSNFDNFFNNSCFNHLLAGVHKCQIEMSQCCTKLMISGNNVNHYF